LGCAIGGDRLGIGPSGTEVFVAWFCNKGAATLGQLGALVFIGLREGLALRGFARPIFDSGVGGKSLLPRRACYFAYEKYCIWFRSRGMVVQVPVEACVETLGFG